MRCLGQPLKHRGDGERERERELSICCLSFGATTRGMRAGGLVARGNLTKRRRVFCFRLFVVRLCPIILTPLPLSYHHHAHKKQQQHGKIKDLAMGPSLHMGVLRAGSVCVAFRQVLCVLRRRVHWSVRHGEGEENAFPPHLLCGPRFARAPRRGANVMVVSPFLSYFSTVARNSPAAASLLLFTPLAAVGRRHGATRGV